jgi:malate synthase
VAHPDLVPIATGEFDAVLGSRANQLGRQRDDVTVGARDLLDLDFPGSVTNAGVETNVSVGIRYIASWLSGIGAAAIDNLMEDVATAEISRSQLWQWVRHGVLTEDGDPITATLIRSLSEALVDQLGREGHPHRERLGTARELFEEVALGEHFVEFLTLPAYEKIN